MKSVPKFMQRAHRTGIRGIVLFAPLPDVALPPQSGRPRSKEDIVSQSGPLSKGSVGRTGRDEALMSSVEATSASARRRRRFKGNDVEHRARKTFHMVQLGDVSASRQALDGACLAQVI